MAEGRQERTPANDEAMLDPWFEAARAQPAEPPLALLSAIVSDAAAVRVERQAAAAASPSPKAGKAVAGRAAADVVGGWKGLTALAACAALGFWIGIAGQVTVEGGRIWSGSGTVASDTTPDDPVGAFFDLASAEG